MLDPGPGPVERGESRRLGPRAEVRLEQGVEAEAVGPVADGVDGHPQFPGEGLGRGAGEGPGRAHQESAVARSVPVVLQESGPPAAQSTVRVELHAFHPEPGGGLQAPRPTFVLFEHALSAQVDHHSQGHLPSGS